MKSKILSPGVIASSHFNLTFQCALGPLVTHKSARDVRRRTERNDQAHTAGLF